jgi:hypothetical protein
MDKENGSCLCGAIGYAVTESPMRVTFCHCRFCQRGTGGAYLVEPIFEKGVFAVTAGTPRTYDHCSEGSGKIIHVHFCETCGTKLFMTFERFPDIVGVFAGTFDNPNWFERSPAISKHIFLDMAQTGTVIPAGFNTFREHATTKDGAPIEPTAYECHHVIGET